MTAETHGFQTEARKLLQLMINSLYSNKEIFLRELISNASDAIDKLRFEALAQPELSEADSDYRILIEFDKDEGTLAVEDNGIGMSRQEVVENLAGNGASACRASAIEFVLEGLHLNQLLNKDRVGNRTTYMG